MMKLLLLLGFVVQVARPLVVMPSKLVRSPVVRPSRSAVSMNLFDRFSRVAKANLNNVLQKWEDPEKVLTQAVEDLQKDLVKIRQSYAEVMATQKRMARQKEQAENLASEWYRRAQLALEKGDEELAREALGRKQQQDDQIATLSDQIRIQDDALARLYESMQTLENKISEAKSTKDTFIARARTAKTATKVNDMLSSVTGSTSMDAFERMKEKVEMLETQAEVSGELTAGKASSVSSEQKFLLMESNSKVDDELDRMKLLLTDKSDSAQAAKAPPPASEKVKEKVPSKVDDELAKLKEQA